MVIILKREMHKRRTDTYSFKSRAEVRKQSIEVPFVLTNDTTAFNLLSIEVKGASCPKYGQSLGSIAYLFFLLRACDLKSMGAGVRGSFFLCLKAPQQDMKASSLASSWQASELASAQQR